MTRTLPLCLLAFVACGGSQPPAPEREAHADAPAHRLAEGQQPVAVFAEAVPSEEHPRVETESASEPELDETDLYRGRVVSIMRRGWTLPATGSVPPTATAVVRVHIGPRGEVAEAVLVRSSGSEPMDRSVIEQLARLRA